MTEFEFLAWLFAGAALLGILFLVGGKSPAPVDPMEGLAELPNTTTLLFQTSFGGDDDAA